MGLCMVKADVNFQMWVFIQVSLSLESLREKESFSLQMETSMKDYSKME